MEHVELKDGMQMPDTWKRETRQHAAGAECIETSNSQGLDDLRVRRKIALLKELHLKNGTAYKVRSAWSPSPNTLFQS